MRWAEASRHRRRRRGSTPRRCLTRPMIALSTVVLPAPLGPSSATASPSPTSRRCRARHRIGRSRRTAPRPRARLRRSVIRRNTPAGPRGWARTSSGRAGQDDLAGVEHRHLVAEREQEPRLVLDDDHRDALRLELRRESCARCSTSCAESPVAGSSRMMMSGPATQTDASWVSCSTPCGTSPTGRSSSRRRRRDRARLRAGRRIRRCRAAPRSIGQIARALDDPRRRSKRPTMTFWRRRQFAHQLRRLEGPTHAEPGAAAGREARRPARP